jgi:hypothetical protein
MENCEVSWCEEARRNFVATVKNMTVGQRPIEQKVAVTSTTKWSHRHMSDETTV